MRTLALTSALLLLPLATLHAQPRHTRFPQWFTNYEAARTVAKQANKPIFLVFRCEP